MYRKITEALIQWKNESPHMPLLLYGARQIGKTYILSQFGKENYNSVVYINFEKDTRLNAYLEISIDPHFIITTIEDLYNVQISPKDTLIIFDEIQACERALTSLKYFCEDAPEYDIVGAGSLLGVKIKRDKFSFPVGKIKILNMYPMDFEEFLLAQNKGVLVSCIRNSFIYNTPMPDTLHAEAIIEYHKYLVIGGMPAVINAYLENKDYMEIQGYLYASYISDMAKYATKSESVKIAEAYDSLPAQLAKDNKKFQYKLIKKGGRSSLYGEAIDWLIQSGICLKCTLTEHGSMPLAAYQDLSSFKLYYGDMGLFAYRTHTTLAMLANHAMQQFMGALTENYIAIALSSRGYELNYWTSSSDAEVDFIIMKNDKIIPVECKANDHVRSRSLNSYMKKYDSEYAIRLSTRNFGMENNIKSVPLYAAFCI